MIRPENFDEIMDLARRLSKPFPHVRVDLITVGRKLYVEELTFYTASGAGRFDPVEWDYKLGDLFVLPKANVDDFEATEQHAP
ncbi:ATP-grasp fold amidoligase family protein [Loktanella sp. SALINAS62]|uniref:ATP-grasp fold amidoligase family protein n=1 Tax=Loktanella sp. SALINAS62 TaxID=2706124 RepID=UPI0020138E84|nr:ATP-grasp fold amidoligase family protein [Loktanella sp. SALINAS62]